MEIVVDTNIIISALLRDGLTRNLLLFAPFDFYTVSHSKDEVEKNKEELVEKSRVDEDVFQYIMDVIFSKISIVEGEAIEPYKKKAIKVMQDIDINDSPFLALAFYLNCPIWSNDKHFQDQNAVKVYETTEVLELLKS